MQLQATYSRPAASGQPDMQLAKDTVENWPTIRYVALVRASNEQDILKRENEMGDFVGRHRAVSLKGRYCAIAKYRAPDRTSGGLGDKTR